MVKPTILCFSKKSGASFTTRYQCEISSVSRQCAHFGTQSSLTTFFGSTTSSAITIAARSLARHRRQSNRKRQETPIRWIDIYQFADGIRPRLQTLKSFLAKKANKKVVSAPIVLEDEEEFDTELLPSSV